MWTDFSLNLGLVLLNYSTQNRNESVMKYMEDPTRQDDKLCTFLLKPGFSPFTNVLRMKSQNSAFDRASEKAFVALESCP